MHPFQTLVEHLDYNKCSTRCHSRNLFPLHSTWGRPRKASPRGNVETHEAHLKELTFHVENKVGKVWLFLQARKTRDFIQLQASFLENSFSIKDTLGLGVGQPLTHSVGLVTSCQAVGPDLTLLLPQLLSPQSTAISRNAGSFPSTKS